MSISTSVLTELLRFFPDLRPQLYFKSSLIALSHAMEDQVLADTNVPLIVATFQRERYYRQEAHRYRRIAEKTAWVYVLSAPETDFRNDSGVYESVAFDVADALTQEWHLVVLNSQYANCLICRERALSPAEIAASPVENSRRFEGIWTFDRTVSLKAAEILLDRISLYRPELAPKLQQTRDIFLSASPSQKMRDLPPASSSPATNPDPFVQRLVTYLQAGQYKLMKAYRSIAAQEQKERLIHLMTVAIRESLDPEEVLDIAVEQLGRVLSVCRCIIYRCQEDSQTVKILHEYLGSQAPSARGETWPVAQNPLFREVLERRATACASDTLEDPRLANAPKASLEPFIRQYGISSWLCVPVFYNNRLQGMVELHHCGTTREEWTKEEISLVEAIATQVGVALIQAEAYANLEALNEQLESFDRTRSNLVAIVGHELRTPLSTIQVCLESLASEPDMSADLQQVMLHTGLADAERMRKLIQDFLTLSQLESGRVEWNPENLNIQECISLSLSNTFARKSKQELPEIIAPLTSNFPLVRADGEWLVQVLAKLLDNACKFTDVGGRIAIEARVNRDRMLEIAISDNGRGIEPSSLETVFDRFYQEEGALQRTAGGTGLGLAICRQIIKRWGGEIWAVSEGKDKGSKFYFTVPLAEGAIEPQNGATARAPEASSVKPSANRTRQRRTKKRQ
ncbi:DICT sensory domain-containing protein [Oscillatoria sp. FACHB-1406]|uniref:DICT sensory domain-containing protein n=1 Tax=Oscillatoria sp. FACHB-1406 TaxID=2692846 RepID=UPI001686262E|nr:DICT sensory domain-containing protein [Oscillatoria sp. FACHB-1406]MBD2579855.1 GAF domain-containing protein [Oscillatoria sp. FACHB-1406]